VTPRTNEMTMAIVAILKELRSEAINSGEVSCTRHGSRVGYLGTRKVSRTSWFDLKEVIASQYSGNRKVTPITTPKKANMIFWFRTLFDSSRT